jgi:hypothetical protein
MKGFAIESANPHRCGGEQISSNDRPTVTVNRVRWTCESGRFA